MAKRTQLRIRLDALSALISEAPAQLQMRLRLQVFRFVVGHDDLSEVQARGRGFQQACRTLRDAVVHSGYALAKAFYAEQAFHSSTAYVKRQYGVHATEMHWLHHEYTDLLRWFGPEQLIWPETPDPWQLEVEEEHSDLTVWVSDVALQDMLFAAIESYQVPQPGRRRFSEVYGLCFGACKMQRARRRSLGEVQHVDVRVERVCLQYRAASGRDYVEPNKLSEAVHLRLAKDIFPWLDLVGDFHTHPYRTRTDMHRWKGWRVTCTDEAYNRQWLEELRKEHYRPRVALVVAISEARRQSPLPRQRQGDSLLRACIGGHHLWIAAHRILSDGSYSDSGVTLYCPHIEP